MQDKSHRKWGMRHSQELSVNIVHEAWHKLAKSGVEPPDRRSAEGIKGGHPLKALAQSMPTEPASSVSFFTALFHTAAASQRWCQETQEK